MGSVTDINLDDSAELTEENMRLLLERAKRAGRTCAKKTRMAFNTTRALADNGTKRLAQRRLGSSNGSVAS